MREWGGGGGGGGRGGEGGHQLLAEREWDDVSPHVRCPWTLWVARKGSLVGESSNPVCGPGEGRRVAARTLPLGPVGSGKGVSGGQEFPSSLLQTPRA